jgi:tetratricopeptide (TPR) repeat protein
MRKTGLLYGIFGTRQMRLILAFAGILSTIPAVSQVQELYLRGIAMAEQGNHAGARTSLEEALQYDENNTDYLLHLAKACRNLGDPGAALEYLHRLDAIEPGKGSYLQAVIHASNGNAGEAARHLEIHLRSPYKLPSHQILMDEAFAPVEDSPQWKKLWSKDWYSDDEVFLQEIRYLAEEGELLQSLDTIDARLEAKPEWAELHAARGNVLLEMKQYQGAVQAFTRALEYSPGDAAVHYQRARAYRSQEKYEKAIADLEKACRLEPENLNLLEEIGQMYQAAGQYGKAAGYLERYTGYFPEKPEARFIYGQIHLDAGRYFDALDQFNACLRMDDTDPRFFAARGKTYLETKTYRYAIQDFGMALDLDANDPEVWYLRGQARWNTGDRAGALSDWEKAARLGSFEAARKLIEHNQR